MAPKTAAALLGRPRPDLPCAGSELPRGGSWPNRGLSATHAAASTSILALSSVHCLLRSEVDARKRFGKERRMSEERGPVIAGIDTHKKEHSLCLLDGLGRKVLEGSFRASEEGYRDIADAIGDPRGCVVVGIECTMTYGAGVCRYLVSKGYNVVEVLSPRKSGRRPGEGKSDPIDAERAARAAVAGDHTSVPKAGDGWVEGLRCLLTARRTAVKASTAAVNAAKALLVSAPERIRRQYGKMGNAEMMAALSRKRPKKDPVEDALLAALRGLALMWAECRRQADEAESRMGAMLRESAPALLAIDGCGVLTASALAVAAGDNPERMGTKHSFAALCGVSPVQASTGDVKRHRLNRGGNRQANSALYQIVFSRLKHDERTKAYMARRRAEGKSRREAIRCLKRYVANEVYRALLSPTSVPEPKGPALREERISLGLMQREVAPLLHISQPKLSALELGRTICPKIEDEYAGLLKQLAAQDDPVGYVRAAATKSSEMQLDRQ